MTNDTLIYNHVSNACEVFRLSTIRSAAKDGWLCDQGKVAALG
jgi:hypothetical protein